MNRQSAPNNHSAERWTTLGTPPAVSLHRRRADGGLVITMAGEADMAVEEELRQVLGAAVDSRPRVLVLEVANLFVDVRGLVALSDVWRAGRRQGVDVVLVGPSPLLRRMCAMLFTDGRLRAHETMTDALGGG